MLGWLAGVHEPAFAPVNVRGRPPIDNNPTPSYLSVNLGWLHFAPRFASILPEKSRIPERRKLKSGRGGVVQSGQSNAGAPV
jgi:hypothetical protein